MVESAPLLREYGGNLIEGSNPSLSAIYSIPGPVIFQARTDGTPSMKIIFSRKGFDSGSGGAPSPIIDGRPTSLPIPTLQMPSITTYADLGLGAIVEQVTRHIKAGKGRIAGASLCHHDPMFEGGRCAFGQSGAAQGHLSNNGIGAGDVFLFFGLFANLDDNDRHHRIFGYLKVEEVMKPGPDPTPASQPDSFTRRHPHTLPIKKPNNTIYVGPGRVATSAASGLRLSIPRKSRGGWSRWRVPPWLREAGLTCHKKPGSWSDDGTTLQTVSPGQEFISDISGRLDANAWLNRILSIICAEPQKAGSDG